MIQIETNRCFAFYPHVRLVRGTRGATIHELFRSRVIWIREPAVAEALAYVSLGRTLADAGAAAGLPQGRLEGHLQALATLGLGGFTDRPAAVEPFRPKVLRSQAKEHGFTREGGRLGVEIARRCVYDCPWCPSRTEHTADACACGVWPDQGEPLPVERLVDAIDELRFVGIDRLVVHGGEPFLEPERLWTLVDLADRLELACDIHSTGNLIDERAARRLRGKPVHLKLLVAGDRRETFDDAVGLEGGFDALVRATDELRSAGVPFSAKVPVSVGDVPAGRRAATWAQQRGAAGVHFLVHAVDCDAPGERLRAAVGLHDPRSFATNVEGFLTNGETHFCFDNALTITARGRVVPCIGWREPLADLHETPMEVVLREDRLRPLTETARRRSPACGGCEFRLGCRACLVRTLQRRGSTAARHWTCSYDPDAGAWPEPAAGSAAEPAATAEAPR